MAFLFIGVEPGERCVRSERPGLDICAGGGRVLHRSIIAEAPARPSRRPVQFGLYRNADPTVNTVPSTARSPSGAADPASSPALERELAQLLVEALNLEVEAGTIDIDAPLYGEGLGLDSIDILEIALEVSQRYGFELRSDDEDNVRIFSSLRQLAQHVASHRTR